MTETSSTIVKLTAGDGCWLTQADAGTAIQDRIFAKTIRYATGAHTADEYTEIDAEAYAAYQTELEEYAKAQEQGDGGDE